MDNTTEEIYLGSRGEDFKNLIKTLLIRGKLIPKYLDLLTTEESMEEYAKAFTAESADPTNNLEVYEQLGDLTVNKFIVGYMYKRFKHLKCTEGVKIVARLRINYGSKQSFYKIAESLGFWSYISASIDDKGRKMKSLLEDAFEAFIGVTECLLDDKYRIGVGYAISYEILSNIFDEIPISLAYEDLYDAKTRIKELFDTFNELGFLIYEDTKVDNMSVSKVYIKKYTDEYVDKETIRSFETKFLGEGRASLKGDAQQRGASVALETLKKKGIKKEVPEIYKNFNSHKL